MVECPFRSRNEDENDIHAHLHRGRTNERVFNVALGSALGRTTVRWRMSNIISVEQTRTMSGADAAKAIDLYVADPGAPPVAIETSETEHDANADASRRLGSTVVGVGTITTAIAVVIPQEVFSLNYQGMFNYLMGGGAIRYAILNSNKSDSYCRFPKSGFIAGTVFDMAHVIPAAALTKEKIDELGKEVYSDILNVAGKFDVLRTPLHNEIASIVNQRTWTKASNTMAMLWLNALQTQQHLHKNGAGFREIGKYLPSRHVEIWKEIKHVNWHSIFIPAIEILDKVSRKAQQQTNDAMKILVETVWKIERANLGRYVNASAELYQRLAEDRSEAAQFYTLPITAELLAGLTIRESDLEPKEWADPYLMRKNNMADMTCGTGTLLRAGYGRIRAFHEKSDSTKQSLIELHKSAIETGIFGTDIFPIATHLTTSSLEIMGGGKPHDDTNIGWLEVGVFHPSQGWKGWKRTKLSDSWKTGALEYIEQDAVTDLFGDTFGRETGTGPDP